MTIAEQKAALRAEILAMAPGFGTLEQETLQQLQQLRDAARAQLDFYAAAGFEDMAAAG